MANYKLELTDLEGDKMNVDITDGKLTIKSTKFDMDVTPTNLKNLADMTISVQSLIDSLKLKTITVSKV